MRVFTGIARGRRGAKCSPTPTEKELIMFNGLKKYRVVKDFQNYKAGQIVAFNCVDAEKFEKNICCLEVVKKVVPAIQTKAVEEVKEETPKKKRVYKRKK